MKILKQDFNNWEKIRFIYIILGKSLNKSFLNCNKFFLKGIIADLIFIRIIYLLNLLYLYYFKAFLLFCCSMLIDFKIY